MFFEGSVRSTRRISFSGRRSSSSRSAAITSSLWVSSSNSATSTEIGWALTPARRPRYSAVLSRKLQSAPTRSLAERRKLTRQRWAWKPITSFASSPSWIEQRIGNALADEARHEVEVIVVHEDRRLSVCLELLGDRVGEALVHARVALLAHRARHPRDVVVRDEPAQRRHEPAAAAPGDPLAVVQRVRHRPAVRDDDQPAPGPHSRDPIWACVSRGRRSPRPARA